MFNLEKALTDWRRQMAGAGMHDAETLDELESHLRADIAAMTVSGTSESEAFASATIRLGDASMVRGEFDKISVPNNLGFKLGTIACGAALAFWAMAQWVGTFGQWAAASNTTLHQAFVFSGNASGCYLALMAGWLGMVQICHRHFAGGKAARGAPFQQVLGLCSLACATFLFASALLETKWHVSWIAWNRNLPLRGHWGSPYNLVRSWVLAGCLIAVVLVQRSGRVRREVKQLMPVWGSIVVLFYCPGIFADHYSFYSLLAVHSVVLLAGVMSVFSNRHRPV